MRAGHVLNGMFWVALGEFGFSPDPWRQRSVYLLLVLRTVLLLLLTMCRFEDLNQLFAVLPMIGAFAGHLLARLLGSASVIIFLFIIAFYALLDIAFQLGLSWPNQDEELKELLLSCKTSKICGCLAVAFGMATVGSCINLFGVSLITFLSTLFLLVLCVRLIGPKSGGHLQLAALMAIRIFIGHALGLLLKNLI